MRINTNELSGTQLDWAVAKIEGNGGVWHESDKDVVPYKPSTNWAQGGPIIEREGLQLWKGGSWNAAYGNNINPPDDEIFSGPTPLVAAMRCYVASKLGDEIEIPIELELCV